MPEAPEELKETVALAGGPCDGEPRVVNPDVLGLILAGPEGPVTYLRTHFVDRDNRFVFVDSDMARPAALDPRLRRMIE